MSEYEGISIELHREANDAYFGAPGYQDADEPCEEFVADPELRTRGGDVACSRCGYSEARHPEWKDAA